MKKIIILSVILIGFIACRNAENKPLTDAPERGMITENAMVVSARQEASKIGADILKKGGNAFDAMVATEIALAVAYPYAGNLGGGGFMIYRKADGDIGGIDYREKAPLTATKDMYLDKDGNVIPDMSTIGAMAVGVPGTIAGVFAVHEKFGTLPIEDILNPVIELAYRGVVVTKKQQDRIKKYQHHFPEANKDSIVFNNHWKENDTIKYPALALTLERILKHGRDEFYKGETAKTLAKFIQDNGGIVTEDDLAIYEAKWRTPVTFTYDDLKIISMSPPSSGGICLAQIMKMVELYELSEYGHNSVRSIQIITEAERRAYADRSYYLGDPDFVSIPTNELINNAYLADRMRSFSF